MKISKKKNFKKKNFFTKYEEFFLHDQYCSIKELQYIDSKSFYILIPSISFIYKHEKIILKPSSSSLMIISPLTSTLILNQIQQKAQQNTLLLGGATNAFDYLFKQKKSQKSQLKAIYKLSDILNSSSMYFITYLRYNYKYGYLTFKDEKKA